MLHRLFFISFFLMLSIGSKAQKITRIEMQLSAFGVESDRFPNIEGVIDFEKGTSKGNVSYYNPMYKPSHYSLSKKEMAKVLNLLETANLDEFKENYSVNKSDQLTSTIVIYKGNRIYTIRDYGLEGDLPLPELYAIIYKFKTTIKH